MTITKEEISKYTTKFMEKSYKGILMVIVTLDVFSWCFTFALYFSTLVIFGGPRSELGNDDHGSSVRFNSFN